MAVLGNSGRSHAWQFGVLAPRDAAPRKGSRCVGIRGTNQDVTLERERLLLSWGQTAWTV